MRQIIPFVIVAALSAGPFLSAAVADDASLVRVLAESASTPRQHAALASYYDEQAAAARKQAEHHSNMGRAYSTGKLVEVTRMKEHCAKLSALYAEQATEFERIAQMHRELAQ
jgi:hypothetical protein